ncbi:MAG: hypothetical protein DYG94_14410 [Leptolyngbya sp. PLA3]|nr:MAG: hypothetical protein EDM82_13420 [Cyanobacteria bacterium CYA]MCE7969921.1 hypothetical protein [Leptolyngbya sp. PL-A3]
MRRSAWLACVAVIAALCVGGAARGQSVSLEPKLGPGRFPARFTYLAHTGLQSVKAGGDMKDATEASMEATFEIGGQSPELTMKFTSMKVTFSGSVMEGKFDSKNAADDQNPLDLVCRPLVGHELKVKVGAHGKIESVEGLEEIKAGGVTPLQIGDLFDANAFRAMFQPVLSLRLEGGEVRVGQGWYYDVGSLPGLGMKARRYELTLRSAAGDAAEIEIGPDPEAKPGEGREEKTTGKATWDTKRGLLSKLETVSEARWTVDQGGVKMQMATQSIVKIERK